jgi:GH35 family endo-1,4-beta-xylanase
MARRHFPDSKLLINDYNITNKPENTRRYRQIIELLQKEDLVDGIGVQAHSFATTSEWPMHVHRATQRGQGHHPVGVPSRSLAREGRRLPGPCRR